MKPVAEANRAAVLAALPGKPTQIKARTGLAQSSVSRILNAMHDEGLARIVKWEAGTSRFAAVWGAESGEHAKCTLKPKKPTHKEYRESATAKRRAAQEAEARERAEKLAAIKVRRDPLVAAFFGEARA